MRMKVQDWRYTQRLMFISESLHWDSELSLSHLLSVSSQMHCVALRLQVCCHLSCCCVGNTVYLDATVKQALCEKSSSLIYLTSDCQQHHSNFVKCYEIWGGTAVLGIGSVDWCTERKHSNVAVFTPESLRGIENSCHWCDFVHFFESAEFISDNVTKIFLSRKTKRQERLKQSFKSPEQIFLKGYWDCVKWDIWRHIFHQHHLLFLSLDLFR